MANTSLAEQLQKLAVPQTSLLIQKKNKQPSLLFDPEEASKIDRSTFYEIGLRGLRELIELNENFANFENTLFDITSRSQERAVESLEQNEKLNKIIEKFLYMLSPYFLLKQSQKALEWLIVRYHIHEYNTDELLFLGLTYHNTNLFARLLQLLDFKKIHSKWKWLYPLQKKGVPLSKNALLNRCASHLSFFKMICDMTMNAVEAFGDDGRKLTTLSAFYSTTILGSIEHSTIITEVHITHLLPSVMGGLESKFPDYIASSYIIICSLLRKTSFQPTLRDKLVYKITKVKDVSMRKDAMLLLNIIYQSDSLDAISLPDKVINSIIKRQEWTVKEILDSMSACIQNNVFYIALIRDSLHMMQRVPDKKSDIKEFIQNLISGPRIDNNTASSLLRALIKNIKIDCDELYWELIKRIERQYPESWDKVMEDVLKENNSEIINRMMGFTSTDEDQINVFTKLIHPSASVKVEAIRYLTQNADAIRIKHVETSLNALWCDKEPSVLTAMFKLPEEVRSSLSSEKLKDILIKCWKENTKEWHDVLLAAINNIAIVDRNEDNEKQYIILLFPFLFDSSDDIRQALSSTNIEFFNQVKNRQNLEEDILKILKNKTLVASVKELLACYESIPKEPVYIFTWILLITHSMPFATCEEQLSVFQYVFDVILPNYNEKMMKKQVNWEDGFSEKYKKLRKGIFPVEIFSYFMTSLTATVNVPEDMKILDWWETDSGIACLYYEKIIKFCIFEGVENTYNITIDTFLQNYFPSIKEKLYFVCNIMVNENIDDDILLNSLKLTNSILKKSIESYSWILNTEMYNIVFPTIYTCLTNAKESIRRETMEIMKKLSISLGAAFSKEITYLELINYLITKKEEIIHGEEFSTIIYEFLSEDMQTTLTPKTRSFTNYIQNHLLKHVLSEKTPNWIKFQILKSFEFLTCIELFKYPINYYKDDRIIKNVIEKLVILNTKDYENEIIINFIISCLNDENRIKYNDEEGDEKITEICTITIMTISNIFDMKINLNLQKMIIKNVLNLAVKINGNILTGIGSFFKKITLNCELIVEYLKEMIKNIDKNDKEEIILWKSNEWKKGITLLELIQDKKKLKNCELIVTSIFDILQICMKIDDKVLMEYTKQICLSCLLNCCEKLRKNNINSNNIEFNIELIVNCLRVSENPQTHHYALLLLSELSLHVPGQILHSIMAIFTFMGSSILRKDDSFSFQIICNIMDRIIPLLIKDNNARNINYGNTIKNNENGKTDKNNENDKTDKNNETDKNDKSNGTDKTIKCNENYKNYKNNENRIITVMKVFVSSMLDIPEHRRFPLLVKLINILSSNNSDMCYKYLSMFSIFVFQYHVVNNSNSKQYELKLIQAVQYLYTFFQADIVIKSIHQLLLFNNAVPFDKDNDIEQKYPIKIFNAEDYTAKQLRHLKYTLLTFVSSILSSNKLIVQITDYNTKKLKKLENTFKGIMEQTLINVRVITFHRNLSKNDSAKYWRVMLSQSLEIFDKTNALMSKESFLSVINTLLQHDLLTIRRKAMELLNWRLQQPHDSTSIVTCPNELIQLTRPLMQIVLKQTMDENVTEKTKIEIQLTQQTALISLKLICKSCDVLYFKEHFEKILEDLSGILYSEVNIPDAVLSSIVLCMAEIFTSLKIHALASIPAFVTSLINFIKQHNSEKIHDEMMILSVISAFQKILETLPNFLSPFLQSTLCQICVLSANLEKNSDQLTTGNVINQKLKSFRQKLALDIESRYLLSSISSCFSEMCEKEYYDGIKFLMDILADSFQTNSKFTPELTNLYISALNFRTDNTDKVNNNMEMIYDIETSIIESLCTIVLKCSESEFRPFYHKLYDWAIISAKNETDRNRHITYYRTVNAFSDKLKGLFVLFASNFIRNAAELLDKNNISLFENKKEMHFGKKIKKSVLLVDCIMKTLNNVFKHATVKFMTKDRFNILLEPLVNQIENEIGDYDNRSQEIIIPCVSSFASSTTDDSLWKQFIYLTLLKTRNASPQVRITALETVCSFGTKLGDNFLPFLPETVPFLAELLEDEEEVVEKRTHKVVQTLEKALGEPIQKYF